MIGMCKFNDVKNFGGVVYATVDLMALPKMGNGRKNSRIHTYTTVKQGTHYALPTEIAIKDGDDVKVVRTTFHVKDMWKKDGNSKYGYVLHNDVIGNIVGDFDDLLDSKKMSRRVKEETIKYYNNMSGLINEKNLALKDMLRAQNEKNEANTKRLAEEIAHEQTRGDLQHEKNSHNETKRELVAIKEKLALAEVKMDGYKQANERMNEKLQNVFSVDDIAYLRFYLSNNNISDENLTKVMNAFVSRKFN